MSFSREVKEELIEVRLRREDDGRKLVWGALLSSAYLKYSRKYRKWGLNLVSESAECIGFIAKLALRSYDLEHEIVLNVHERLNARNTELFLYGNDLDRLRLDSGLASVDVNGEKNYDPRLPEGLGSEHSLRAFVRGMFLMCGTVSDPKKGCHAELALKNEKLAENIIKLLTERNIPPKLSHRRNFCVVYFKNGDTVEDFLTFMGAGEAMLRVSEQRMIREAANNSNREVNCFAANQEKAALASAHSAEDIRLIVSELGYDAFSEELYEVAAARLEDPDFTLTQLSEKLGIGRSAVNYRLKKIKKLADELRAGKATTEK